MLSSNLLLLVLACLAVAQAQPRVAIIGGGVAGSAAAYYVRQELGQAEIEVFERDRLGGRSWEQEYDRVVIELGASIVWHKNYLVMDLAAAAGLEWEVPPGGGLMAVYDGRELVFEESEWRILTLVRLLLRYGLSWFTFRSAPAAMFAKFTGIYPLLDKGVTFERPENLLQAVGLYELTQASMFEFLRETYGVVLDLLGRELIAGIGRVNYNQNNQQLNALAGHVSMLPATEPSVFRVRGGNSQLASHVLEAANATVHRPVVVSSVQQLPDGQFQLELQPEGGHHKEAGEQAGPFDAVIVATPLEASGLSFPGLAAPAIPARKYQQTVTTIIKGSIRPSYFGLSIMTFAVVMVTEDAQVPWSSLSLVGRTASDNTTLWKMFSAEPLPHAWLEMMYEAHYEVVANKTWNTPGAYPKFDPPEDFAPFKLANGLFYTAALENAASALEIAAIEGRMTALLAAKHIKAAVQQPGEQKGGSNRNVLVQSAMAGAEQDGAAAAIGAAPV